MFEEVDFAGKKVLITAGADGLGLEMAKVFRHAGASVFVCDVNQERLAALPAELPGVHAALADVSDEDSVAALFDQVRAKLGGLDILVNNAGVGLRARLPEVTPDAFDRVLQVNLKTPFFLIQQTLPFLRDHGRIVNVSSMGTRAAYPEMSVYAPAKAGLEALTLLLASELGARGITVNAVLPGATATDLNARARDPEQSKVIAQTIALGRVGQPEDIADIVAFLASHEGRWITGQRIDATGGQRL
jgi:NAD(P)-dependent dehydrogenase (short-subunit alcohol dehydrogenase family)